MDVICLAKESKLVISLSRAKIDLCNDKARRALRGTILKFCIYRDSLQRFKRPIHYRQCRITHSVSTSVQEVSLHNSQVKASRSTNYRHHKKVFPADTKL